MKKGQEMKNYSIVREKERRKRRKEKEGEKKKERERKQEVRETCPVQFEMSWI